MSEPLNQKLVCAGNIQERSRPKFKPQVCLADDNKVSDLKVMYGSGAYE